MKRHWRIALLFVAVAAAALFWRREPAMMALADWRTPNTTLAEHEAFMRDGVDVLLPETGAAPYPVVLQFHGCAGMRREFHEGWANVARDAGYAVMLVDSNGQRGIGYEESLETVCQGKVLLGQERAGDILAAINLAKADRRLDAEHLILAGWSHGAWSVMDFLTMDMKQRRPAGLVRENVAAPEIAGVILFYPHCGPGALSRFRPWRQHPPSLALIAGKDTIVDADECIAYFQAQEKKGRPVELIVYPEADHIFDDATIRDEHPQYYSEEAANDARARYRAFLVTSRQTRE